jgi:hypothetical protein
VLFVFTTLASAGFPRVPGKITHADAQRGQFLLEVGKGKRPLSFDNVRFEMPNGEVVMVVFDEATRPAGDRAKVTLRPMGTKGSAKSTRSLTLGQVFDRSGTDVMLYLGRDGKTLQLGTIKLLQDPRPRAQK